MSEIPEPIARSKPTEIAPQSFQGISAETMLQAIDLVEGFGGSGLMKARESGPGVVGGVELTRGIYADDVFWRNARGIRESLPPIPFALSRETRRKNPVMAACVNLRKRQVREFSEPSGDDDIPGYRLALADKEAKPTPDQKDAMKYLSEFFYFCGRTDFVGWEDREDILVKFLQKQVENGLTIDTTSSEIQRDSGGAGAAFHVMDSGTIRRAIPGGYRGSKTDFDPRSYIGWDEFSKKLAEAKMDLVPDPKKIRFVQEINGRYVAAFELDQLVHSIWNERPDIRYAGVGFGLVEQAISVLTGFQYGIQYNQQAFDTSAIPKLALVFPEGNFGSETLMKFQDQWIANFKGIFGQWRMPMLNGKVQALDLMKSPRDLEYGKYMELTAALAFAIFGVDPQEVGLRLMQAQNVLNENVDAKLKFSKDRGLHDMLGSLRGDLNRMMVLMKTVRTQSRNKKWQEIDLRDYRFTFTGLNPIDAQAMAELDKLKASTSMTVNEIRARDDLPKEPFGDILLDPTYIQYRMQKEQAEQAQQQEQAAANQEAGDTGDIDAMLNEALDGAAGEMTKAGVRPRTLLI